MDVLSWRLPSLVRIFDPHGKLIVAQALQPPTAPSSHGPARILVTYGIVTAPVSRGPALLNMSHKVRYNGLKGSDRARDFYELEVQLNLGSLNWRENCAPYKKDKEDIYNRLFGGAGLSRLRLSR